MEFSVKTGFLELLMAEIKAEIKLIELADVSEESKDIELEILNWRASILNDILEDIYTLEDLNR